METIEEHSKLESSDSMSPQSQKELRICLIADVAYDAQAIEAAKSLKIPIELIGDTSEIINETKFLTFFVLKDFQGPIFEEIHKSKQCVLGPPALKQIAMMPQSLTPNARPLYNYAMRGVVTCFTGIRKKDELTRLVTLIHAMGGCIRKDMNSKITHLISNHSSGEKYRYAKTFRLTVVRPDWVYAAWERRHELEFVATTEEFSQEHKLKPFEGQKISFFGFPTDEHQHMVDVLQINGGIATELDDTECSHVVVEEHSTQTKPNAANVNAHILKSDWFWYTIQNGYADETDYLFGDYLDSIANTPDTDRRESLPISLNKRKRKRFSQRLKFENSPIGVGKRRSASISDAVYSSFNDSFLDCTPSPDVSKIYVVEPDSSVLETQTPAKKSMRFYHFMDFVNTESNYVGILDTIVTLFKIPLEKMCEDGDALLNHTEIKSIFGNFLSIHKVHQRMLQRLRSIQNQWTEDCLIGDIILELKDELIKSYPPYINFFDSMKGMLAYCDSQNPRFHAFLKINQTKPECGRQSLQDLMIRPVQRLPSISLLLNDILKHTAKSNPDYVKLEEALKAIKEVMTYINEDKRKTESRVAIFDIFNDIEGCPAHLVSSNRNFLSKCEVVELSDEMSGRGDALVLYLFSDTIEVCKKRSRGFNAAKSPGSTQKTFKHVKLLPLNTINFVIDIIDSPRAFALLCRQDKDKLYSFTILDEEVDKIAYIKDLCKQMAHHACRADAEKSLLTRTSQELDVDISNVNSTTLSKAFKLAARTRRKVGRAFSFNKTPSKLKRAVSTMMTSPFGSINALALTPGTQLAQMRLTSCTNIHEATNEDGNSNCSNSPPMLLEPPLSVQSARKNKSSNLNSLGRL